MSCRSYSDHCFNVSARWGVTSTNAVGKGKRDGRTREGTDSEKPTELFPEREFKEHFCVPNGISIRLMDDGLVSTENESFNVIVFSKKKFNAGSASLFLHFLNNSYIL